MSRASPSVAAAAGLRRLVGVAVEKEYHRVTVQPIRLFGDPVLRTAAEPVVDFDKELRQLVADLVENRLADPPRGAGPGTRRRSGSPRRGVFSARGGIAPDLRQVRANRGDA